MCWRHECSQSYLTLCKPMDFYPPGSSVHGIHQAPLSMGFSRQEYWNGMPFLPPGELPNPGIEPASLMSPALAGGSLPLAPTGKPLSLELS